jgi:hypothetical protein
MGYMDSPAQPPEPAAAYLVLRAKPLFLYVPLGIGVVLGLASGALYIYLTGLGSQNYTTLGVWLTCGLVLLASLSALSQGIKALRSRVVLDGQMLTVHKAFTAAKVDLSGLRRADCKFVSSGPNGDVVLTLTDNQNQKVSFSLTTYSPQGYQQLMPVIKQYCARPNVLGNDYAQRELSKY